MAMSVSLSLWVVDTMMLKMEETSWRLEMSVDIDETFPDLCLTQLVLDQDHRAEVSLSPDSTVLTRASLTGCLMEVMFPR